MTTLIDMETKVPDFTLEDVDGQEFNLYDRLGKAPLVLVFRRGSW